MPNIILPSTLDWINAYTASGIASGKDLLVRNYYTKAISVLHSNTKPALTDVGYAILPGEAHIEQYLGKQIWILGEDGNTWVEEYNPIPQDAPSDLYTFKNIPDWRRFKVDPEKSCFLAGRQFRTFLELNIPSGASQIIQFNVAVDTAAYYINLVLDSGFARMATVTGATVGTAFSTVMPIIPKNSMTSRPTPYYTPQNTLRTGGTITGGTEIDVLRLETANSTAQKSSVGAVAFDERAVGPGTYYWKIENIGTGAVTGVFSLWYEERLV